MSDNLSREDAGNGVCVLSFNRAPVNALNPQYLGEMEAELADLENDTNVRAVVLTSGLKVFSAGMDLKEAMEFSKDEQRAVVEGLNGTYTRLYALSKPVITAANGAAIAGGLFFILAADYTIASERGKFGLTEARVGVNFPVAPLEIARAALNPAAFRQIMLGGNLVDAQAAKDMGMVDEVVPPEGVLERAITVARDYASIPPKTYAAIKAQMREGELNLIRSVMEEQSDPTLDGWYSDETKPAMAALLEAATKK